MVTSYLGWALYSGAAFLARYRTRREGHGKTRRRVQRHWSLCSQKRECGPTKTLISDAGFQNSGRIGPAVTFLVTWYVPGVRTRGHRISGVRGCTDRCAWEEEGDSLPMILRHATEEE